MDMKLLNLTFAYFKRRRQMRKALPIAAAIAGARALAQEQDHERSPLFYDEVAEDALGCLRALEEQIYHPEKIKQWDDEEVQVDGTSGRSLKSA